jgi:hypothetical protein
MRAVSSFKKIAGTALSARGEHDQISAVNQPCRANRASSAYLPNAAIWISNDWLGTAGSPESSTHCQEYESCCAC